MGLFIEFIYQGSFNFVYSSKSMSGLNLNDLYKEGKCKSLDPKLRDYRKMRTWQGTGISRALTEKESDVMAELWRKEILSIWKMTMHEVSTLMVGFR